VTSTSASPSSGSSNSNGTSSSIEQISRIKRLHVLNSIDNAVITGFSMSVEAGPLCLEPMVGVCFEVLSIDVDTKLHRETLQEKVGPLSGQVIAAVKNGCNDAFLRKSARLVEAIYECHVQVFGADNLGKVYGVISRRRGKPKNQKM